MSTPSNNNYAPPKSVVADVATDTAGIEKASRGSRLLAVILDGIIISLPLAPSYFSAFQTAMHGGKFNLFSFWAAVAGTGTLFYLGGLIDLGLLILTGVFVYQNGQTIGKKILGIKVVRSDGSRAGLARIFWLRYLVAQYLFPIIPMVGMVYALVDSLMIFGEARRCCHDYIADTIVVRA
jgi:uncharacterized RDD family membrane protein YckC